MTAVQVSVCVHLCTHAHVILLGKNTTSYVSSPEDFKDYQNTESE